jgi:hypothetical protein
VKQGIAPETPPVTVNGNADDPALAQVLSPRKKVVELGVPVALKSAMAIKLIDCVIVGDEYA